MEKKDSQSPSAAAHFAETFAGKEIEAREFRSSDSEQTQVEYNTGDPVLHELETKAGANGMSLHLCFGGQTETDGSNPKRLNVPVEKGEDNKWRIGKNITLG